MHITQIIVTKYECNEPIQEWKGALLFVFFLFSFFLIYITSYDICGEQNKMLISNIQYNSWDYYQQTNNKPVNMFQLCMFENVILKGEESLNFRF